MNLLIIIFCVTTKLVSSENVMQCGRGHTSSENDLYEDEHETRPGNWPWIVKLTHRESYLCGGSIFDREFILTSAHCLEYLHGDISNINAVLGAHKLLDTADHVITVKVKKIFEHPFYDNKTYKNDIAIAQLEKSVDFETNMAIRPICLSIGQPSLGEVMFVIGWGTTRPFEEADHEHEHPKHPLSNVLKQARMEVVEGKDYCKFNKKLNYYPSGYCTAFTGSAGHHECLGDSGSPVVRISHKGDPWYQQGVVSWSEEDCGGQRHPAVNTVVYDYVAWIRQVVNFTTGGRQIELNPYPKFK